MKFSAASLLSLLLIPLVSASPIPGDVLVERQSSSVTCGGKTYSASQVRSAVSAGYGYYQRNQQIGSNKYPHAFNNREGFDFLTSGPFQEWPIISSGTYNGGSPGADRVVFNTKGVYAGSITHTGAGGNNFVGCSDVN